MNNKKIFEEEYEKPIAIWTEVEPPKELVELIENDKIKSCKVLDVGCGEGFYSIYLAKQGFEVTGIDISENAIKYAGQNAEKAGVDIQFVVMNLNDLSKLNKNFDFIFEWSIVHLITPLEKEKYIKNINNVLKDGGKYLCVCFNINTPQFGNRGKKEIILGEDARALQKQKLYFYSLDELKKLFENYFKVIGSRLINRTTRGRKQILNYLFMKKI